jgi:hypothetical protein
LRRQLSSVVMRSKIPCPFDFAQGKRWPCPVLATKSD